MQARKFKFGRTKILLLSEVSLVGQLGTNLVYSAQIGRLAITIEVFHRNESDGTRFSKFQRKRIPPDVEVVGHPWLLFLAWKHEIFCYYCKLLSSGCALKHITQYLSSLKVLHLYLPSGQRGTWPERRY